MYDRRAKKRRAYDGEFHTPLTYRDTAFVRAYPEHDMGYGSIGPSSEDERGRGRRTTRAYQRYWFLLGAFRVSYRMFGQWIEVAAQLSQPVLTGSASPAPTGQTFVGLATKAR